MSLCAVSCSEELSIHENSQTDSKNSYVEANAPSPEIVVSGQRQQHVGNVPARDVPQNIQTLDSSMLEAAGITRLETALDLVSGTSRQDNFGACGMHSPSAVLSGIPVSGAAFSSMVSTLGMVWVDTAIRRMLNGSIF